MSTAAHFENCAGLGGEHFTVTGAEPFNGRTQLLACTVACWCGQAEVHVHFARNGNGIETGSNIRNISNNPGITDFPAGSNLAMRCIEYAHDNKYVYFPH